MKYLLSIICFSMCFSCVNAQLSIGYRGGVYHEFDLGRKWVGNVYSGMLWTGDKPKTELSGEIFTSYRVKRWLFGIGYMRFKNTIVNDYSYRGYVYGTNEYIETDSRTSVDERTHYINTTVSYDCSFWKSKKLRGYLGLAVSPIYIYYKGEDLRKEGNGPVMTREISGKNEEMRYGLVYTAMYQANAHVSIVADVAIRTKGTNPFPEYETNTLVSGQIGVAYWITP